jgi:hypothetical protein
MAEELLKAPEDRQKFTLQPDRFERDHIWMGMDDLGILEEGTEEEQVTDNNSPQSAAGE